MGSKEIAERLAAVRTRIEGAARAAGRDPLGVRLVAVTKGFGPEAMAVAHAAGQRCFGENYAQELEAKAPALAALNGAEVRFIGRAQRRKVKALLALPSLVAIETIDDRELASEIEKRAAAAGRVLEVMIQVNVGREPNKSGCAPEAVKELVAHVRSLPHLRLSGLMTVPPRTEDAEGAAPFFVALRELALAHGLAELSMGMSHDLEVAVREGATSVRVGTAIFGERG